VRYFLLIFLFVAGCGAFVSEDVPVQALNDEGYTNVRVISSHWLFPRFYGCSKEDHVSFECVGERDSKTVSLTVCSSLWFKGSTVRH